MPMLVIFEYQCDECGVRQSRVGGVHVGDYQAGEARAAWETVLGLLRKTGATPQVDSVWEFEKLPEAFARLAAGPMGKVVLRIP